MAAAVHTVRAYHREAVARKVDCQVRLHIGLVEMVPSSVAGHKERELQQRPADTLLVVLGLCILLLSDL